MSVFFKRPAWYLHRSTVKQGRVRHFWEMSPLVWAIEATDFFSKTTQDTHLVTHYISANGNLGNLSRTDFLKQQIRPNT